MTAKVDDYYGFVIRRLAARGELPPGFHAADPGLAPVCRATRRRGVAGGGRWPTGRRVAPEPVTAAPGLGAPPGD